MLRPVPVLALIVALLFGGSAPRALAGEGAGCHGGVVPMTDFGPASGCSTPQGGNQAACDIAGSGTCQVPVIAPGDIVPGTASTEVIPALRGRSGYRPPDPDSLYRPPISAPA